MSSEGASAQVSKLRDANNKYKSLLKMAKQRIQNQEEELDRLQAENRTLTGKLEGERTMNAASRRGSGGDFSESALDQTDESNASIVRVIQRVRVDLDHGGSGGADALENFDDGGSGTGRMSRASSMSSVVGDGGGDEEIWALLELETLPTDADGNPDPTPIDNVNGKQRRWRTWKKFPSESALADYTRRDAGEPIVLPPYSLSPDQSQAVEAEARQAVSHITEEFRRYRVRAEVLRKQSDATLRALHSNTVHSTQQRIEGEDLQGALQQAKSEHAELLRLRNELKDQETQWKEAYDALLAENTALKGSGAEALLASQWRHRYEATVKEKEELQVRLDTANRQLAEGTMDENGHATNNHNANSASEAKYERKYREMKESFRLYRKKAKEIFEQQQRGEMLGPNGAGIANTPGAGIGGGGPNAIPNGTHGHGPGGGAVANQGLHAAINDRLGEDARIGYLRNLMVNFLSSDDAVREHMEVAIGTVLRFTEEDLARVEEAKNRAAGSWF